MKYTFMISQVGVMEADLIGVVGLRELCFLDYLAGWFFCDKAECVTVNGREFRWVDYAHAIGELPLLFHPSSSLRTHKNNLAVLVRRLRSAGLVETESVGRRLHFRLTDKAARLNSTRRSTVTETHDDTVTPSRDDSAL